MEACDDPDAHAAFVIQARILAELRTERVTFDLGTDVSTPWAPHAEMEDMAVADTTPPREIAVPARDSADLLRLAAGTTATGERAHFLALGANPPDDINHTRRIVAVHLNGEEADRSTKGQ